MSVLWYMFLIINATIVVKLVMFLIASGDVELRLSEGSAL